MPTYHNFEFSSRALLELRRHDIKPHDIMSRSVFKAPKKHHSMQSTLKIQTCALCCRALLELLRQDIKPRDIMTRKAFENAITVVMALGGSTNAVLHLLAMAHAVDVDLTIDDFQTISDSTPFIADLKPSGKYVMEDLHKVMHLLTGSVDLNLKFEFLNTFYAACVYCVCHVIDIGCTLQPCPGTDMGLQNRFCASTVEPRTHCLPLSQSQNTLSASNSSSEHYPVPLLWSSRLLPRRLTAARNILHS